MEGLAADLRGDLAGESRKEGKGRNIYYVL